MAESGEHFDIYVNGVQVSVGMWDLAIDLFLRSPDQEGPSSSIGRIRMSPQQAIVLAKILQKQMDFYQQTVGPVVLPDQLYRDLGLVEDTSADT